MKETPGLQSNDELETRGRGRRSIFITGAANGIGRASAVLFASKNWFVGAFDVDEVGLATLADELGSANCLIRKLDVSNRIEFQTAIQAFGAETTGKMDVLFNNAAVSASGWFEDIPYERALRVVEVNLVGVVTGIYAALPLLKVTPNSLCLTTCSGTATHGMPRIAVYSATKHAIKGLTEALSIEFARYGIRVADILPGLIDTKLRVATTIHGDERGRLTDQEFYAAVPRAGMFRLTPPSAVADVAWRAVHENKLHWYVPTELVWVDRIKGFFPKLAWKIIARSH